MRFAIVVSEFNEKVTGGLLEGAKAELTDNDIRFVEEDLYTVPGAFEIPLVAKKLARSGKYRGVICLGAVIKGETAHFEFISLGASVGMMQTMLETEIPVSFGVLTTYDSDQALRRSRNDAHNKGREAALACLKTARLIDRLGNP